MTAKLPEWTNQRQFTDRNWKTQMGRYHDALAIAIETLTYYAEDEFGRMARMTLKRIEEMG
jgi:hypothetical protein